MTQGRQLLQQQRSKNGREKGARSSKRTESECLRSLTGSSSRPWAILWSHCPVLSPNSILSLAAGALESSPTLTTAPEELLPPSSDREEELPESSAATRAPSFPPRPRMRSSGRPSISRGTAALGRAVCWLGLWRPLQSLAMSLLSATPALQVKPVRASTSARARATIAHPAASSRSLSLHSASGLSNHPPSSSSFPSSVHPGAAAVACFGS